MSDGQTPYDKIIYPEGAYSVAHPDRMAVVASLLGMHPPPLPTARILELGTGTGGHLIPIAYQYPEATCVGIDYAQAQVAIARDTVEAVGLTNITFHALNFMDFDESFGQFDYIIAHGIFSWIPDEVQHRLLDIVHRHLTPDGVAYISYNTFPGWRMLQVAADIMRFRTRGIEDPWEKARVAREVIGQMASLPAHTNVDSTWERFMNTYHEVMGTLKDYLEVKTDHVLLHDDLEDSSRPFYFYEFCDMLAEHELTYLADSAFSSNMMSNLAPDEQKLVKELGHDFGEMEQYIDFIRNRTFRTSLVVHKDTQFSRNITPLPIANFYVSTLMKRSDPQPDDLPDEAVQFHSPDGRAFTTGDSFIQSAMDILIENKGTQISFRELVRLARQRTYAYIVPVTTIDEDASKLAPMLLQAYGLSLSMVEFYTTAPSFLATLSERPLASKVARFQAMSGEMVTNQRQNRVQLGPNARALIGLMDGTNDRDALIATMQRMTLQPEDAPAAERLQKMTEEVERLLEKFRESALLVG